ncbi:MAG TPA: hypothetical protein VL371_23645 [Gemmataceae bacterium]|jgi:hypothetical protein|nr:hypothetical protein [Gemmataceae bacterium]
MLSVHQPKLFSRNLELYDGSTQVATIGFRAFSRLAEIQVGGTSYTAGRSGWFQVVYSMQHGEAIIATAEPTGFWRRTFELRTPAGAFTLRREPGWMPRGWVLLDGDSQAGSVTRRGFFQTETVAEFDPKIDLATQVFVVWFANVLWQQDRAAAAAAG